MLVACAAGFGSSNTKREYNMFDFERGDFMEEAKSLRLVANTPSDYLGSRARLSCMLLIAFTFGMVV